VFLVLTALLACPTFSQTVSATQMKNVRLVDAHNHIVRGMTLDDLIEWMDNSLVQRTLLMPIFLGGDDPKGQGISDENLVIEWYKKQPDRIIPFLGMQRTILDKKRFEQPDAEAEKFLQFTEDQLRTGIFKGMGEFILRQYSYSYNEMEAAGVKISADAPLMKRFLDLAAKYKVPVIIHCEIDKDSLPSLRKMLEYGRQVKIILAHNGGRPDTATLQALLESYPNVFCDLAGMTLWGEYGFVGGEYAKNPIVDKTHQLLQAWKNLFEQYPDRFVGIGIDVVHPRRWDRGRYGQVVDAFRIMLSALSPQTADKISYQNAEKIFGLTPS